METEFSDGGCSVVAHGLSAVVAAFRAGDWNFPTEQALCKLIFICGIGQFTSDTAVNLMHPNINHRTFR